MRNGIDTVEISRIEKLLADLDTEGLRRFFSEEELSDAGGGAGRSSSNTGDISISSAAPSSHSGSTIS